MIGQPSWATDGIVQAGEYSGMHVSVERDPSGEGWHLWLVRPGTAEAWDIWADDEEDVRQWLAEFCVEWRRSD